MHPLKNRLFGFLAFCGCSIAALGSTPETPAATSHPALLAQLTVLGQSGLEAALDAVPSASGTREQAFWQIALDRSRFQIQKADVGFWEFTTRFPDTLEAQAAVAILGIDLAEDQATALYHFNSLASLAAQHPECPLLDWMVGVMARTLSSDAEDGLPSFIRTPVLRQGVIAYRRFLAALPEGRTPTLVHQTLGNLLDDLNESLDALPHRQLAFAQEPAPWSAHAAADTLKTLGRWDEALDFIQKALDFQPDDSDYLYVLGGIQFQRGEMPSAIQAWQKAIADPSFAEKFFVTMTTLALDGEAAEAARDFAREGLRRFPDNKTLRILAVRSRVLAGEPVHDEVFQVGTLLWTGQPSGLSMDKTPWGRAISGGDLAAVRQLAPGRNLDEQDSFSYRQTALMVASCSGWWPIVEELLRLGASTDLRDENGDTALHYATQFGHPACAERLLAAGAATHIQDKWGQTPLTMAASNGKDACLRQLLKHPKTDLSTATWHGGTALHYAAGFGRMPMVEALLAAGANPNLPCPKTGFTPAMNAVQAPWWHYQAARRLLAAGADISARDREGRTLLHHSLGPWANEAWVRSLLDAGARPDLADKAGCTPFQLAAWRGHRALAEAMRPQVPPSASSAAHRWIERTLGQAKQPEPPPPTWLLGDPRSPITDAERLTLPLHFAYGDLAGLRPPTEASAQKTLRVYFGVSSDKQLSAALDIPDTFAPHYRTLHGLNPLIRQPLDLTQIARHDGSDAELAQARLVWTHCRRLYLASLGQTAGWLSPKEAERVQADAVTALRGSFSDWDAFARAFLHGATLHAAWDHPRYQAIFDYLLALPSKTSPWPASFWHPARIE
jgi:ankyrin repeat protein